jgi:hypothetical protein
MGATIQRLSRQNMWARAGELVERAPSLDALRAHRLQFLAASIWREQARAVPTELLNETRAAAMMTVAAPVLLKRARAAYGGDLVLMKGPEVAANYPDPSSRYFGDLDLLADDPVAAQRALIAAGFAEIETTHDYSADQHLCPLVWPGLPIAIEIHRRPSSPAYLDSPPAEAVLELAVPSATKIDGLMAPAPAAHALLLVAHSWTHHPLGRVGDLIDVVATLPDDGRPEAAALARRWGWERMWQTTLSVADALLEDGPPARPLRSWARHLAEVREPTVLESHLARATAPIVAVPPAQTARGVAWAARDSFGPGTDERWTTKLHRATRAIRHPFENKSHHDREIGRNPWSR